jgi:hypothetical protein
MSLADLGKKVKVKYPEYNDLPDEELGKKVLKKYPEYGDIVSKPSTKPKTRKLDLSPPTAYQDQLSGKEYPIYKEDDPSTWAAPSPEEEAIPTVGQDPNAGLIQNMVETLMNPAEAVAMAGTGGITGAMKGGIKQAGKEALEYGTYGAGSLLKGAKGFAQGLKRGLSAKNLEKTIPVEKATPLASEALGDVGRAGIPSSRIPLREIEKKITQKPQDPSHAMPYGGRAKVRPSEHEQMITKETKKTFKNIGELSDNLGEKRLLRQTGTFKPPEMSRVPRKPGMEAILRTEELTGMNKRVRKGPTGKVAAGFETPIRMFEKLGGNAKRQIYDPIDDADLAAVNEFHDVLEPIIKRWKSMGVNEKKIGKHLVARQGDEGEKILRNMGKKTEPLSPTEKEVVKEIDVFYEEMFDRINDARVKSGIKPMGRVKNYYTFFRQLDWLSDKLGFNPFQKESAKLTELLDSQFLHRNSTFFKHAKERKKNFIPVDINAFSAIKRYGQNAYNHIHISPQIAKAREIVKPIQESLPEAHHDITRWLDFVSGTRPFQTSVDKQINALTKNTAMAIISGNVRSALIQPSAIRNTLVAAGPINTFNGLMIDLPKQAFSKQARDFVWKNSNLPARKFDVLVDQMAGTISGAKTKIGNWGTKPLQVLDLLTANASWSAFHRKATKSMGMSGKDAIRYANDMIVKTQASARKQHIAPIQRSAIGKTVTTLQTFVINDWAFLTQEVLGMGKNVPRNAENLKKVFYYIAATTGVNTFYEDVLDISSPYGRPVKVTQEELSRDDPNLLRLTENVGKELIEGMPVIGGSLRYKSSPAGAAYDALAKAPKAVGGITEDLYGGESVNPYELETLGKIAGIPGTSESRKAYTRLMGGEPIWRAVVGTKYKKKPQKVKFK